MKKKLFGMEILMRHYPKEFSVHDNGLLNVDVHSPNFNILDKKDYIDVFTEGARNNQNAGLIDDSQICLNLIAKLNGLYMQQRLVLAYHKEYFLPPYAEVFLNISKIRTTL